MIFILHHWLLGVFPARALAWGDPRPSPAPLAYRTPASWALDGQVLVLTPLTHSGLCHGRQLACRAPGQVDTACAVCPQEWVQTGRRWKPGALQSVLRCDLWPPAQEGTSPSARRRHFGGLKSGSDASGPQGQHSPSPHFPPPGMRLCSLGQGCLGSCPYCTPQHVTGSPSPLGHHCLPSL